MQFLCNVGGFWWRWLLVSIASQFFCRCKTILVAKRLIIYGFKLLLKSFKCDKLDARQFLSPSGFKLLNLLNVTNFIHFYCFQVRSICMYTKIISIFQTELAKHLGKILADPSLWNSHFDWRPHYDITR